MPRACPRHVQLPRPTSPSRGSGQGLELDRHVIRASGCRMTVSVSVLRFRGVQRHGRGSSRLPIALAVDGERSGPPEDQVAPKASCARGLCKARLLGGRYPGQSRASGAPSSPRRFDPDNPRQADAETGPLDRSPRMRRGTIRLAMSMGTANPTPA